MSCIICYTRTKVKQTNISIFKLHKSDLSFNIVTKCILFDSLKYEARVYKIDRAKGMELAKTNDLHNG